MGGGGRDEHGRVAPGADGEGVPGEVRRGAAVRQPPDRQFRPAGAAIPIHRSTDADRGDALPSEALVPVRLPEGGGRRRAAAAGASAAAIPDLDAALTLAGEFAGMVRQTVATPLSEWIAAAMASGVPELVGFANGLRSDAAAVQAALTTRWNNGPVEGQVGRLKAIKRQMFGRAGIKLLRPASGTSRRRNPHGRGTGKKR